MVKRLLAYSLLLSVLLHLAFLGAVWFHPEGEVEKAETVEVTILSPEQMEELKNKQIVEQDKRINDDVPEDEAYLSKYDQRVVKETKAEKVDKFDNTAGEPTPPTAQKKPKPGKGKLPSLAALKPQFDWNKIAEPKKPSSKSASATDDYLKDVETGAQTLLNTREFVYYTYYSRIKAKLRQYWEPKIKEKISRIVRQGREIASAKDRITKIIITLDNAGTLIRVQVVGRSGIEDLDEAAVEAFRAAAPFPNPPKGIIDPDGTIKIRWDFILEANSTSPIRFQRQAKAPDQRRFR